MKAERLAHAVSVRCKLGEQLVEMKEDGVVVEGRTRTVNDDDNTRIKLEQLVITPDQSSNYQAMAAIPEPVFDELVHTGRWHILIVIVTETNDK